MATRKSEIQGPSFDLTSTLFYYPFHRPLFVSTARQEPFITCFETGAEMRLPLPSNWL